MQQAFHESPRFAVGQPALFRDDNFYIQLFRVFLLNAGKFAVQLFFSNNRVILIAGIFKPYAFFTFDALKVHAYHVLAFGGARWFYQFIVFDF